METDKRELFLMEYEDLCKKHRMLVSACGCCNSPQIITEDEIKSWKAEETFEQMLNENTTHLGNT